MKKKHNYKELVVILLVVIFLALSFFLPKGAVTGFVSFSIYPDETINNSTEEFGVQPTEDLTPQTGEDSSFSIQPIENISTQEDEDAGFSIQPIEEFGPMAVPVIDSVILNSTNPANNDTNQNLTCWNISVTDADSDPVKTIFNWWYNNTNPDLIPLMQLYLPFEENGSASTVAKDYSGYGNDGSVSGATFSSTSGYDNFGAYSFVTNDFINAGGATNLDILGPITVTTWINTNDPTAYQEFICKGDLADGGTFSNYCMVIMNTGVIRFGIRDMNTGNYVDTSSSLTANTWYHFAVTFNPTTNAVALYLNGTLDNSGTITNDPVAQTDDSLYIGALQNGAGILNAMNGELDEVRIYNHTLSANQIRLLYENKSWITHSNETSVGDHWKCEVTPFDGTSEGTSVNSSELKIEAVAGNNAPTITPIYIYSDADARNDTNVNLTGVFGVTDLDADSMIANETKWYNNSVLELGSLNLTTVSYLNTTKNDNWMFSARTHDGTDWSIWTNSTNFTILNAAPTIGSVILNTTDPNTNYTTENLTCWNTTTDADSDPVKTIFNWWHNTSSNGEMKPIMLLNMPFEENGSASTVAKDYSGYGNDGSITGATFNSSGGRDGFGAYEFNGSTDYIKIPDDLTIRNINVMSTSFWIYPKELEAQLLISTHGPYQNDGGFIIYMDTGPNLGYQPRVDGSVVTKTLAAGTIKLNQWQHIVITHNASGYAEFYINGILNDTNSFASDIDSQADPTWYGLTIGKNNGAASHYFNGTIDEVQIYNYSLSANQIQLLYKNKSWMIHSDETSVGDHWKCEVTPNDGTSDGTAVNSSELKIEAVAGNNVPTITPIYIYSDADTRNDTNVNLTGVFDVTDIDADSMILNQTRWYNNSILELGMHNLTAVSYLNTTKDDNWMFSARTNDGTNWSTWTNSSNFTILSTNNVPTITPIYIYSDADVRNDTNVNLTGVFDVTDIDADSMIANETKWYNNSILELGSLNQTTVSYLNTTKNDDWMFSARTYDGTDWSIWTNSTNFTILNAAPTITSSFISSEADARNDTNVNLTAYITGFSDIDSDTNVHNQTRWYNNSILELGMYNLTSVSYLNTTKNDDWMVEFRVSDGTNWSSWTNSSNFTILNALPTISSAYIYSNSPSTNYTNTTLTATFSVSDIDTDSMTANETRWYNNSVYQSYLDNFTLIGSGNTTKNDNWMVELRTYDGTNWSSWTNSSNITILNSAPTEVNLISPANDSSSTTKITTFKYNVSDLDSDVDNCTLWIGNSSGIVKAAYDNSVIENNEESFTSTLDYETINWTVQCTDSSNAKTNSTTWFYTIIQPTVATATGGPSRGRKALPKHEIKIDKLEIILDALTKETVKIENLVNRYIPISIDLQDLNKYITISENTFTIDPYEIKEITISVKSDIEETIKGDILVSYGLKTQIISVTIRGTVKAQEQIPITKEEPTKIVPTEDNRILFILLIAIILAALILAYKKVKKYKHEIRIGIIATITLLSAITLFIILGVSLIIHLVILYTLGIIAAAYLIIKQIKFLKKTKKHKVKAKKHKIKPEVKAKITPEKLTIDKEYQLTIDSKYLLELFNNLIIDILEDMRKGEYHKAIEGYDRLNLIYEKLDIKESKKIALKILLEEIDNKIELDLLKQKINKKTKKQKLEFKHLQEKVKKKIKKEKIVEPKVKLSKAKSLKKKIIKKSKRFTVESCKKGSLSTFEAKDLMKKL